GDLARRQSPFWELLSKAKDGRTNILPEIEAILETDDLHVERCRASVTEDQLDLSISSRVKFASNGLATLRFVPTLGGYGYTWAGGILTDRGSRGIRLQLFAEKAGAKLVWVPDLGTPERLEDEIAASFALSSFAPRDI